MQSTEPFSGQEDPSAIQRLIGGNHAHLITVADLIASFDQFETWHPVAGWPGYEVSSFGRARSKFRVLTPGLLNGYPIVSLSNGPLKKTFRLHILTAKAFLGDAPFEGAIVAHNDGDPGNGRLKNLRWATPVENQHDRARHGTWLSGSQIHNAKLREEQIPVIRQRIASGEVHRLIAADFGVSVHTIGLIGKNKIWKRAGGAAWPVSSNEGARA